MHQIKPAATSSVTKMAQETENYHHVTVSTLGPQTRSEEVEASLLSEWVQIVMAKLIGMIKDQESVLSPSVSLYTVQTQAITQAAKRVFFFYFNHTLS